MKSRTHEMQKISYVQVKQQKVPILYFQVWNISDFLSVLFHADFRNSEPNCSD